MGTKSALGNKRQLTNQIAGKDASLFFSFFWKTQSSLDTKAQMDVWNPHLLSHKMAMLQNMVVNVNKSNKFMSKTAFNSIAQRSCLVHKSKGCRITSLQFVSYSTLWTNWFEPPCLFHVKILTKRLCSPFLK